MQTDLMQHLISPLIEANGSDDALQAQSLELAYDNKQIFHDLNIAIPRGKISVIVGPNACGKSTLLRVLSRLLKVDSGQILLDGKDIHQYPSKTVAKKLGLLPQSSLAPFGISVSDLVSRGRYPHQSIFRQWTAQDEQAVWQAMQDMHIADLAQCSVEELSGGQRQRVWLAMLLAQDTPILLLDEPTTYLDISHQLELLELCKKLNRQNDKTIVMVLHDLNQATQYADYLIAMKAGKIIATGTPSSVMTVALIKHVFQIQANIMIDPITSQPWILPIASVSSGE